MQNKLISIICPLFNKERYVEETINSVLKQNSRNWELLLIDDGSTDKSVEIAKHYAIKDKRIKFYKRSDFKNNCLKELREAGLYPIKGPLKSRFQNFSTVLLNQEWLLKLYIQLRN